MDFLKELFGESSLNWDGFSARVKEKGVKLADLSGGKYIDKQKHEDEVTELKNKVSERENDLATVKQQLESAGVDKAKLTELTDSLTSLQTKYDADTQDYQMKLTKQAYEFAVREYANGLNFSSGAAKREFVRAMIDKGLQLENDKILGADDFCTAYKAENADSFAEVTEPSKTPQFTTSTNPQNNNQTITKDVFKKMSYTERNELFSKDKALYDELSKE